MKKLIIDTHILIWWLIAPEKLKQRHLEIIQNEKNIVYVSIASFFEISLKVKKGKLEFNDDFENILSENGFQLLPISLKHLEKLQETLFTHQDPFDMIIIAQSLSENIELISYDEQFKDVEGLRMLQ